MFIQESYTVVDTNDAGELRESRFGESGLIEAFTNNKGELFRALRKEHGKCTGKIYLDTPDGSKACGWRFEKLKEYSDSPGTYLSGTWVSLFEKEPEVTRKSFPLFI